VAKANKLDVRLILNFVHLAKPQAVASLEAFPIDKDFSTGQRGEPAVSSSGPMAPCMWTVANKYPRHHTRHSDF